ncbi:MAG TPA: hypothetical protein VJ732_15690 [Bryobacteraceae bacterium]|nr:hypothetical protein [Bryobacteraceae bacterium]
MSRRLRPPILALLCFYPVFLSAQTPELAAILQRLDRLEQENQALAGEVQSLRAEVASLRADPPGQPAGPSGQPTVEQQLNIQEHRIDELAQTKVEASQRFPIRLTGMALVNAFMDSHQNGGREYPTIAFPAGPGQAGATFSQSILGLEFGGPQTVWGGHVHGSVYMDFFSGTAPLSETVRFRTGSIELDWADRSFMAGIEKPIFNPREPSSLAQVGVSPLTGAGNLWLWLPQARFEQDLSFGRSNGLRARLGVVETHEVGAYSGSQTPSNVETSRPGLEGRFEFFHKFDEDRRLEIAPGFHVSTTHVAGLSVPSQLVSADWFFNPIRRLEFTGAFYRGQNVANLGTGSIRQGFGFYNGEAEAVHSQGGWAQLTIHTTSRLDFHVFSGQQDDRNADLVTGGIGKNLLFGANFFYHLAPNVILGPEVSQVRTVYLGQATLLNNHYDLALAYLF